MELVIHRDKLESSTESQREKTEERGTKTWREMFEREMKGKSKAGRMQRERCGDVKSKKD